MMPTDLPGEAGMETRTPTGHRWILTDAGLLVRLDVVVA